MSSITAVPLQPVKRSVLVYVWAGIVIAVLGAFALAWMGPLDPASSFLEKNRKAPGVVQTASGLQYEILTPGTGPTPTDTDIAGINFEGKLLDGMNQDRRPCPVAIRHISISLAQRIKNLSAEFGNQEPYRRCRTDHQGISDVESSHRDGG